MYRAAENRRAWYNDRKSAEETLLTDDGVQVEGFNFRSHEEWSHLSLVP